MRRVQRQDWAEAEGRVYWFDNFLEAPRCEGILAELEFAFWRPSTVYLEGEGGKHQYVYSRRRVSSTTSERWFTPPLRRAIALIDRRVGRHLPQAPSHREEWQATIYERVGGSTIITTAAISTTARPAKERTRSCSTWRRPSAAERRGSRSWIYRSRA